MRVLVTGAAGSIGRVLTVGLADRGHEVVGLDRVPAPDGVEGPWHLVDCADPDAVAAVFAEERLDAVVHLAGHPGEPSLPDSVTSHVVTTAALLDAMVEHDVRRLVYASSNHAVGRTPRTDLLTTAAARVRTLLRRRQGRRRGRMSLYADRYGIDAVACRIGSFLPEPETVRHLSTWLSHDDCVRMVEASLTATAPGFAVLYGISANTRAWWDLAPGRALGYDRRTTPRSSPTGSPRATPTSPRPPTSAGRSPPRSSTGRPSTAPEPHPSRVMIGPVGPGDDPVMGVWKSRKPAEEPDESLAPRFTRAGMVEVPQHRIPDGAMLPQTAYQIVLDEVMLDGNARFNLATFVTTWMDEEADRLYAATFDKNMIDKDEYPQTAEIEARCVRMLGDLWHAPHAAESVGTSTTGSSEGCMLGGLALKRRWQQRPPGGRAAHRPAQHRDGRQRPGRLGEVRELLGGRAALRAARGRRLPPDRRPAARLRRREHDRRRGGARLDDGRHLRAGPGDLRRPGPTTRRTPGSPSPCTSTPRRRLHRAVRPARPGLGLPARPGGLDPDLGPQVRPGLPRHRLGAVARRGATCPRTSSST